MKSEAITLQNLTLQNFSVVPEVNPPTYLDTAL